MYEPPLLDFYDNAILNNGDPDELSTSGRWRRAAPARRRFRPAWPPPPAGFVLPRQSINAVDPDFKTQSAWLSNVQIERALDERRGGGGRLRQFDRPQPAGADRRQPDARRARRLPTAGRSSRRPARGRSRRSTAINMFKSIGESTYNAFTATLAKRMTHGWMAQATYTLARGEDNAPLTGTYVVGSSDDRVSDPTNLDRDEGRDAVQPDAHAVVVGRDRAAGRAAAASARCCSTTTSSGSSSRPTAACRSTSARTWT